jgi:exoribonuclease R
MTPAPETGEEEKHMAQNENCNPAGGAAPRARRKGSVFLYFNPFRYPSRLPLQVRWDNREKGGGVLIEALKPLAHDVLAQDHQGYHIESRSEDRGVLYIDRELTPHLIYGNVPYVVEVGQPLTPEMRDTFWAVEFPIDQASGGDTFRVELNERFDSASILDREVEMVKRYYGLPPQTPAPLPEEAEIYKQIFREATQSHKLIDVHRFESVADLEDTKERYDLRHRTICTIDSETTRDIDDAVEIVEVDGNRYILGVHIADVTEFVKQGSERDRDANERGTSHYPADRVIHMLPECLCEDYCSLRAGKDRLTLSVYAEVAITEQGFQINGVRFARSVTRSKARLTYNEVEKILQGRPLKSKDPLHIMLALASHLAKTIEAHAPYHDLSFQSKDFKYYEQQDGRIQRKEMPKRESDTLIEMFMITANRLVGQRIADIVTATSPEFYGIGVYRAQAAPSEKDLREYLDKLKRAELISNDVNYALLRSRAERTLAQDEELSRCMSPIEKDFFIRSQTYRLMVEKRVTDTPAAQLKLAVIDRFGYKPGRITAKAGLSGSHGHSYHHSLGINRYAWFTSPIRRYPDIVNHRQLKAILSRDRVIPNAVDVRALAEKLKNAGYAENALNRRLLAYYLCHQLALDNIKTLPVRIASFQWLNRHTFKLECLWQGLYHLGFLFKEKTIHGRIDDDGLSCRLNRSLLRVGDEVTIKIADHRDISPEKGAIEITAGQIRAARRSRI